MSKQRILVVDDERPLAFAISYKLKALEYEVETAFNGEEALEKIKNEAFDLILLDLMMPKINGFEVLEAIKKPDFKTPVIVSSNLSQTEEAKRAMTLGATRLLVKSDTSLEEIAEYVQEILGSSK